VGDVPQFQATLLRIGSDDGSAGRMTGENSRDRK
jgi:hypothetical protein